MSGNASFRLGNTSILSVGAVEAPIVMPSSAFDERLAAAVRAGGSAARHAGQARRGPRAAMVARATSASPTARRWPGPRRWPRPASEPEQVGVMINTSVSREHLEPSTAVAVHHQLGLPTSCLNFDLANACLGFVNGIQLAGTMIDSGQADYALIVDAEGSRHTQEVTLDRLIVAGRHGRRLQVAVRDPHAGVRCGRHGAGSGRRPPGGPSGRRRRQPGRHRAPRPVRR